MRLYFSQQVEKGFHVEQGEVRELKMILVGSSRNRGFPGGSDGKESACNAGDPGLIPGLGRSPWGRKWQPTLVLLPGESHGQGSLAGYNVWSHKESDRTEQLTLHL